MDFSKNELEQLTHFEKLNRMDFEPNIEFMTN